MTGLVKKDSGVPESFFAPLALCSGMGNFLKIYKTDKEYANRIDKEKEYGI